MLHQAQNKSCKSHTSKKYIKKKFNILLHIEKQHGMYQVVNQKKLAHKTKDIKKNLKSIIFLISNILAFSY